MKPINIIRKLNETYESGTDEALPGEYECNDCGKAFDYTQVGPGYSCPYCHCGDIIEPSFEDSLDYLGITSASPLYYVSGTPEDCHTIEDADKYYASLPTGSSVNYSKDKSDITPEQYEFLDKHRPEVKKEISKFVEKILSYGPLD